MVMGSGGSPPEMSGCEKKLKRKVEEEGRYKKRENVD